LTQLCPDRGRSGEAAPGSPAADDFARIVWRKSALDPVSEADTASPKRPGASDERALAPCPDVPCRFPKHPPSRAGACRCSPPSWSWFWTEMRTLPGVIEAFAIYRGVIARESGRSSIHGGCKWSLKSRRRTGCPAFAGH